MYTHKQMVAFEIRAISIHCYLIASCSPTKDFTGAI